MNVLSSDRFRGRRRSLIVPLVSATLAILALIATSQEAGAQTPPVEGPWVPIDQVVCFTESGGDEECSNETLIAGGATYSYNDYYGQRFEYGAARRAKCYYTGSDGPEAHEVNSLFLMMSCRIGIAVGGLKWVGAGIALMGVCWVGFKRIIESMGSSSGEGSSLRYSIGSLVVGLILMFSAYPLALLIHTISKYNFLRYLYDPGMWSLGP